MKRTLVTLLLLFTLVVLTSCDTPKPTEPCPGLPADAELILEDDFSFGIHELDAGQSEDGSVGYESGSYSVSSSRRGLMVAGLAHRVLLNCAVEVKATQVSAPNKVVHGLRCRHQSNSDGYLFLISEDGQYGVFKVEDGEWLPLANWRRSSDIVRQAPETNQITAVCEGSTLLLCVNGQELARVEDDRFLEGDVALVAASLTDQAVEVQFDDLRIYQLP